MMYTHNIFQLVTLIQTNQFSSKSSTNHINKNLMPLKEDIFTKSDNIQNNPNSLKYAIEIKDNLLSFENILRKTNLYEEELYDYLSIKNMYLYILEKNLDFIHILNEVFDDLQYNI